jgi:hypothetical protein
VFPFTTPFLYDPAAGNLVLDLQIVGNGSAATFDTVLSGDPAIGRVFANSSSTATTGTIWADTHVTQFTFEPPPLVTIRASQVEVCWNSISNLTYQVQYRSDLTTNLWTSLGVAFEAPTPRVASMIRLSWVSRNASIASSWRIVFRDFDGRH